MVGHVWVLGMSSQYQEPTGMTYGMFGLVEILYIISLLCPWTFWKKPV